jgi:hypothetical protein
MRARLKSMIAPRVSPAYPKNTPLWTVQTMTGRSETAFVALDFDIISPWVLV